METDSLERVLAEQQAFETLRRILVEEFGRDATEVTFRASFRHDLAFDSLELSELVLELEDAFLCEIPDDELGKLVTVGDAVRYALCCHDSRSHS